MGVIVSDTFTGTENLVDHTPDTGTGWTEEVAAATAVGTITGGIVKASADENDNGMVYTAQPNPSINDYDIELTLVNDSDAAGGSKTFGIVFRWQDSSNSYALTAHDTAGEWYIQLLSGGSPSTLATYVASPADGDTIKIEVRSTNPRIRVLINGTERLTSNDTTITSPGKVGLFWGNTFGSGVEDIRDEWQADDFIVTEISSDPDPLPPGMFIGVS